MANRAVLAAVEGASERDLRMADYLVPLFWLACLSPDDELVREQLDDDDPDDYRLYIDVAPATALARFESRGDALDAILDHVVGDHGACRQEWTALLSGETRTLRFDVTEIVLMTDTADAEFTGALAYFEHPTDESGAAIVAITCIRDVTSGGHNHAIEDYLLGYA